MKGQPFVKIGHTMDGGLHKRMHNLQLANPTEPELLATCPGSRQEEQEFHRRLGHLHHRGEWFRLEGDALKLIEEMRQSPQEFFVSRKAIQQQRAKERKEAGHTVAQFACARELDPLQARRRERELWWLNHGSAAKA